ncbi:hypothetical protein GCM10007962_31350 [Yeosuana aromativorans]|uniref:OmpA-like domain-containing protein n=1 Tax=Yeosuana aromativorans TaxID=288019 RepID=A0A8J3FLH7_9FLAO|nr:OmpA family protein [Yeosuana aromativorans]GGK34624.1 hypothetical protein GCM10007962_31350 [Yeosuana aromativorans]
MILKKGILSVFLFLTIVTTYSQNEPTLTKQDSTIVSLWVFGVGFNAIDDSGNSYGNLFDIKKAWNAVPFPSRLSIGKYFKNGLGIEGIVAYNKYKKGKIVDNFPLDSDKDYFSIDSRLSYDLNKIIGNTGWFDPYLGIGVGYTHANDISRGTYNGVVGFRVWFSDNLGLDVNSSGKWAMKPRVKNHLQHALGLVYRFNIKKELTEEGMAKLDTINAIEKENARVKDSVALAKKIDEEHRLKAQEEQARLAQIEKEKEEAREREKSNIQDRLNALENIYFPFDWSRLTPQSKDILSKLVLILNDYPKLSIEVDTHTDSRGSTDYNQSLSERRLQSILNYLNENGIEPSRIVGKAYGELRLFNECDDHTKCSEAKHRENRKSVFKILNF